MGLQTSCLLDGFFRRPGKGHEQTPRTLGSEFAQLWSSRTLMLHPPHTVCGITQPFGTYPNCKRVNSNERGAGSNHDKPSRVGDRQYVPEGYGLHSLTTIKCFNDGTKAEGTLKQTPSGFTVSSCACCNRRLIRLADYKVKRLRRVKTFSLPLLMHFSADCLASDAKDSSMRNCLPGYILANDKP